MNIAVAQSGGPTCAINASLAGVFLEASRSGQIETVFGVRNGIEGMLRGDLVDLSPLLSGKDDLRLLMQTPSTVLGSCRCKLPLPDADEQPYRQIHAHLLRREIGAFFYIGGNDSMDTVSKLSAYLSRQGSPIRVIGIPKTIDNDLVGTDHTPGFGSAAKFVATALREIVRDSAAYRLPSVTIVEVMGRHAGWLAASCCVASSGGGDAPDFIYLPECPFSAEGMLEDLRGAQRAHKAVVAVVSEGVELPGAGDETCAPTDAFGHRYLSGVGKRLEHAVRRELGCKVRSVELNVLQRCSSHLASLTDLREARRIGAAAVRAALRGESGRMMVFRRVGDRPYRVKIAAVDASSVANREKRFPAEWINGARNNVLPAAVDYFLPLIQGEPKLLTQNGLPRHFVLD